MTWLSDHNISNQIIAEITAKGEQAIAFHLHFLHEKNRGVKWNRHTQVNGKKVNEVTLLLQLVEEGKSSQEIANTLNKLFDTTNPTHPSYRSQAAVISQLTKLYASDSAGAVRPQNVLVPGETDRFIKKDGKLVLAEAQQFITDNYFLADQELAHLMGVSTNTLQQFCKKNNIPRIGVAHQKTQNAQAAALPNDSPLKKIDSAEIVLDYARQWEEHQRSTFDAFRNFKTGAMAALSELEGFSNSIKTTLKELYANMNDEAIRELNDHPIIQAVKKYDGRYSQTQSLPAQRIQDAIYLIYQKHNESAKEPNKIDLANLSTKQGMQDALFKLTGRISLKKDLELTAAYFGDGGARTALLELTGFYTHAKTTLKELYANMNNAVILELNDHPIIQAVKKEDGDKSRTYILPAKRIQDAIS